MKALLLTPIVLSLLVLAAHFLRGGNLLFVMVLLTLVALLPLRKRWVGRLVQATLLLGALEWARTTTQLAMARADQGEPFLRMVLILGVVTAVTLASGLLFSPCRHPATFSARAGTCFS
ncbi:MAG: hypothetical protein ACE5GX_04360, partial [Thermoanaerobaculia bacterium]